VANSSGRLRVVNRAEPLLAHLARLPSLHPERLYATFLDLAGDAVIRRPADPRRQRLAAVVQHRQHLGDEARQRVGGRIRTASLRLSLMLESDDRSGYHSLGLARIAEVGAGPADPRRQRLAAVVQHRQHLGDEARQRVGGRHRHACA
jgi:predicted component of type VI protein secretion system